MSQSKLQNVMDYAGLQLSDIQKAKDEAWERVVRDGTLHKNLIAVLQCEKALSLYKMAKSTPEAFVARKAEIALLDRLMFPKNKGITEDEPS